jgi:hypothetical protein
LYTITSKRGVRVRASSQRDSEEVGLLKYGSHFHLLESAEVDGHLRLRTSTGWITAKFPSGVVTAVQTTAEDIIERCMLDSMPEELVSTPVSIEEVGNRKLFKAFLSRVIDDESSVELTFHGTPTKNVEKIVAKGLRPSDTGLFGAGVYVGTHAGKAHNYTRPDPEGWRHMFCVLVDVGPATINRTGEKKKATLATSTDSMDNPTEYCFFERDRLFISHLITYRVNEDGKVTKDAEKDAFRREFLRAVARGAEQAADRTQTPEAPSRNTLKMQQRDRIASTGSIVERTSSINSNHSIRNTLKVPHRDRTASAASSIDSNHSTRERASSIASNNSTESTNKQKRKQSNRKKKRASSIASNSSTESIKQQKQKKKDSARKRFS